MESIPVNRTAEPARKGEGGVARVLVQGNDRPASRGLTALFDGDPHQSGEGGWQVLSVLCDLAETSHREVPIRAGLWDGTLSNLCAKSGSWRGNSGLL